jgi:hypothetical protein
VLRAYQSVLAAPEAAPRRSAWAARRALPLGLQPARSACGRSAVTLAQLLRLRLSRSRPRAEIGGTADSLQIGARPVAQRRHRSLLMRARTAAPISPMGSMCWRTTLGADRPPRHLADAKLDSLATPIAKAQAAAALALMGRRARGEKVYARSSRRLTSWSAIWLMRRKSSRTCVWRWSGAVAPILVNDVPVRSHKGATLLFAPDGPGFVRVT